MTKLTGTKGFNYKRLTQAFDEEFEDSQPGEYDPLNLPKAPKRFDINVSGFGTATFGPGSDNYADLDKEDLAQMVVAVFDGNRDNPYMQVREYWMQFPKIVLVAIVSDTHGNNQ